MKKLLVLGLVTAFVATSQAVTIEYWDFEDGVNGAPFDPDGGGNSGSVGVNGTLMRGWDNYFGPGWTNEAYAGNLAMNNADNHQDGYVFDGALMGWTPTQYWSIEAAVKLDEIAGWETVIGRDGATDFGSGAPVESDFYMANNGIDDAWRLNIKMASGQQIMIDTADAAVADQWYVLRAMGDGTSVVFDVDDGSGFVRAGTVALDVAGDTLADSSFNWTFGRGWFNGGHVDHIDGQIDNVGFYSHVIPEPATFGLVGIVGAGMLFVRRHFMS